MPKLILLLAALSLSLLLARASDARQQDDPAPEPASSSTTGTFRGPLASRNQTPLALLFGYLVPESARSLERGAFAIDVALDYSNIIMDQSSDEESIRLDLEYLRTELALRRGFASGLELGLSLPFYSYYGGFLDPFVSGFHDTLGLPNFLRGQTENGLVEYRYATGVAEVFSGTEAFNAVGDLSLHAKKTLVRDGRYALAARALLKLPTGELERLSGSGETDFGFGLAFDRLGDRFGLYANASYHVLGEPESLPVKNYVAFMVGADWRFKPRFTAVLQLDHLRPPIEGDLRLFRSGAQQLAVGLRFGQSDRLTFEWRFVEDLSSFSPDFTAAFQIRLGFGTGSHATAEAALGR